MLAKVRGFHTRLTSGLSASLRGGIAITIAQGVLAIEDGIAVVARQTAEAVHEVEVGSKQNPSRKKKRRGVEWRGGKTCYPPGSWMTKKWLIYT